MHNSELPSIISTMPRQYRARETDSQENIPAMGPDKTMVLILYGYSEIGALVRNYFGYLIFSGHFLDFCYILNGFNLKIVCRTNTYLPLPFLYT